jgi:hypothetical protein
MLDQSKNFFIDVLNLVPIDSLLLIQTPHKEALDILDNLVVESNDVYKVVPLTETNRTILLNASKDQDIQHFFQSIAVRYKATLIFEGYDGMEYGLISKNFSLPDDFKQKYVKGDMCGISKDW